VEGAVSAEARIVELRAALAADVTRLRASAERLRSVATQIDRVADAQEAAVALDIREAMTER